MTRLACIAAAALAFAASTPFLCATTTPASAQSWRDDAGIGDDLRDLLMDRRSDRRDMLMDLLSDRRERRGDILERISDRRERRGDLLDLLSERRDLREELMDLIGDDGDRGGGRLRGRLRERISDRLGGGDEENCFFVTRTLRDEGGDWMVLVRRRVCRD